MPLYTVTTGKVTLTAAATKSLILVNPATIRVKLRAVTISLDGSAAAGGVQFDLYRVATLGSPTGASTTPQLCDEQDSAAVNTTHLTTLTAEPTTVSVIDSIYLQPLGGAIKDWQPFGAEGLATKTAGARIGLRYVTAASVTPDCIATFYIEE